MNDRIKFKQEFDPLKTIKILKSISNGQPYALTKCTYTQIDKRYLVFIGHFTHSCLVMSQN